MQHYDTRVVYPRLQYIAYSYLENLSYDFAETWWHESSNVILMICVNFRLCTPTILQEKLEKDTVHGKCYRSNHLEVIVSNQQQF